jgi:hypothetical protein
MILSGGDEMTQTTQTEKNYRVVRQDNGPKNPATSVEGHYSTLAAAKAWLPRRISSALAPSHGCSPYAVQVLDGGEWRNLTGAEEEER